MLEETWRTIFDTFHDDPSKGSAAWLVGPDTVRVFIQGLLREAIDAVKVKPLQREDLLLSDASQQTMFMKGYDSACDALEEAKAKVLKDHGLI